MREGLLGMDKQLRYEPLLPSHLLSENGDENQEIYWKNQAQRLLWRKPFIEVCDVTWTSQDVQIKWFEGGELNVSENCLDRHLKEDKNRVAFYYEGNEEGQEQVWSYQRLYDAVCRFANALKSEGVQKGDVVTLYMPLIPQSIVAMLACTRIGAVHSVVFGGFSAASLAERINDAKSEYIVTADYAYRGHKKIPLRETVHEAKSLLDHPLKNSFVFRREEEAEDLRDYEIDYEAICQNQIAECEPVSMKAEDPLFILYTSGSTGKPKGLLHTTGGYLTYVSTTQKQVFPLDKEEIYWCTADIGWITGHSYVVYGPLVNGVTSLIFEGVPQYPHSNRWWALIEKYKVNAFYTAPTALRSLKAETQGFNTYSRGSLKLLGSVGEPIDTDTWNWYYFQVGQSRCPILDTWWQTETGGILITSRPGDKLIPSVSGKGLPQIEPVCLDENGEEVEAFKEGALCIKTPWPGQARTIFGDHQRFIKTYFSRFDGFYMTGDGAYKDKDGFIRVTGRIDDIIIVSGHNLSTAELEVALLEHDAINEVAVVGQPHPIKGASPVAFVVASSGQDLEKLRLSAQALIRQKVGAVASIDQVFFIPALPKTRSGKTMRRLLRALLVGETLSDISTLADPTCVDNIRVIVQDKA